MEKAITSSVTAWGGGEVIHLGATSYVNCKRPYGTYVARSSSFFLGLFTGHKVFQISHIG